MNYLKVYCNLIRKAQQRQVVEGYTEKHHIFPVSIFGKNNKIVVLTGREHYLAHALLEKVYLTRYGLSDQRTYKMICAHMFFAGKTDKYYNSYLYEASKIRKSENMKGEKHHLYGVGHTEESKKKIKDNHARLSKEKHPWWRRKHTEESKLKMSQSHKGQKVSEETKQKLREKNSGENNYFYGKTHSLETRQKISEFHKNKILSEETKEKIKNSMMGEKNPFYGKQHNEETKRIIGEKNKGKLKGIKLSEEHKLKISISNLKTYQFLNPEGELITINNLTQFCKENNIDKSGFYKLLNGSFTQHKGWRIPQ
jgi:hypothetical protein